MKDFVDVNGNSLEIEMVVDSSTPGLMSTEDKTKLDGIANSANAYSHPTTHDPSIITQDASNRFVTDTEKSSWNGKASTAVATTTANGLMSAADKVKLNGIAVGANAYSHPTTHAPSIIVQDASNRFVTDAQITAWNAKAAGTHNHSADNITSGTLPIARGGTGATTAAGIASAIGLANIGYACCAKSTAGTTVTLPQTTITKVPLSTFSTRTDTSVFEISNGGVKVNKAGTVLVCGSVYINLTSNQTPTGCYIYKGTTEIVSQFILQYTSGAMSSGMRIINVAAGDIFYLHTRSYTATTYNANLESTNLCIAYLK